MIYSNGSELLVVIGSELLVVIGSELASSSGSELLVVIGSELICPSGSELLVVIGSELLVVIGSELLCLEANFIHAWKRILCETHFSGTIKEKGREANCSSYQSRDGEGSELLR